MTRALVGITAAIYALYSVKGLSSILFGQMLPHVTEAFGISLATAGLVSTLFALGRIIGSVVSGPVSDRFGAMQITWAGIGGMILGLVATGLAPHVLVFFAGSLVLGLGFGTLDVTLNTSISALHPERRASMLSLLHGFYGVGSSIGPVILSALILLTGSWRSAPWAVAAFMVIAGLWYRLYVRPGRESEFSDLQRTKPANKGSYWATLRQPVFLMVAAVGFIYQGVAWSLNVWLPTFMIEVHRVDSIQAGAAVSAMYIGLTAGRFVNSIVTRVLGDANTLLAGAVGSLVAVTVSLVMPTPSLVLGALVFVGLCLGTLLPTSLAVVTRLWPETAGTVSGAFMTVSSLAVLIVPWFLGFLGDLWGMRASLGVSIAALVILVACVVMLRDRLRDADGKAKATAV